MVYKDSAGKEIHEGDSLMDLTPGFVGEISEVFFLMKMRVSWLSIKTERPFTCTK